MFCPDENLGMFQIMIINVHLTMTSGQSAQARPAPGHPIYNLKHLWTFKSKRCLACQLNLLEQPKIKLYEDSST